jgi:hypothetical protein
MWCQLEVPPGWGKPLQSNSPESGCNVAVISHAKRDIEAAGSPNRLIAIPGFGLCKELWQAPVDCPVC